VHTSFSLSYQVGRDQLANAITAWRAIKRHSPSLAGECQPLFMRDWHLLWPLCRD